MKDTFKSIHKQYMHLVPLITAIMFQPERYAHDKPMNIDISQPNRLTKSQVGNWFEVVKKDTLRGRKLLVGTFVRRMHVSL